MSHLLSDRTRPWITPGSLTPKPIHLTTMKLHLPVLETFRRFTDPESSFAFVDFLYCSCAFYSINLGSKLFPSLCFFILILFSRVSCSFLRWRFRSLISNLSFLIDACKEISLPPSTTLAEYCFISAKFWCHIFIIFSLKIFSCPWNTTYQN